MPEFKLILFDYDGVLTLDKTGSLTTCRFLGQATGLGTERVEAAFAPFNHDMNLGRCSYAEIWGQACERLAYDMDFYLLRLAFESTPPNPAMFELARSLRSSCRLGIVTDNKADRIACLRRHQDLDTLFDPILVSAERGCDKSGPGLFRLALEMTGCQANECLFIDNSAANLVAARSLGMATWLHDDAANDVSGLRGLINESLGA